MSFFGESCHPYIDQEIQNEAIRDLVDSLVKEEMGDATFHKDQIEDPVLIDVDLDNFCNESKYENLLLQESIIDMLGKRKAEFWRREKDDIELGIEQMKRMQDLVSKEINTINTNRMKEQQRAGEKIRKLEIKEQGLMKEIQRLNELLLTMN